MYVPDNNSNNDVAFFFIWSDKPNLQQEILDAAKNPDISRVIFFAQEEWETFQLGLTEQEIQEFFDNVQYKVYAVYGGVKHNINTRYKVKNSPYFESWPDYFAYVVAHRHIESKYPLRKPSVENLSKHFVCMNGRPHYYRSHFIDEMFGNGFFDYGYISWHEFDIEDYKEKHEWKYWTPKKMEFDKDFHSTNGIADIFVPPVEFSKSVFSIVSESNLKCMFFTEKTWLPIYNQKPILIYGHPYSHTFLERKLGYKLHHNIIDYSFDLEYNDTKRLHGLMKQIEKICLMPLDELYEKTYKVANYNRKLLLQQIKDKKLVPPKLEEIINMYKDQDQIDYYHHVLNISERFNEAKL